MERTRDGFERNEGMLEPMQPFETPRGYGFGTLCLKGRRPLSEAAWSYDLFRSPSAKRWHVFLSLWQVRRRVGRDYADELLAPLMREIEELHQHWFEAFTAADALVFIIWARKRDRFFKRMDELCALQPDEDAIHEETFAAYYMQSLRTMLVEELQKQSDLKRENLIDAVSTLSDDKVRKMLGSHYGSPDGDITQNAEEMIYMNRRFSYVLREMLSLMDMVGDLDEDDEADEDEDENENDGALEFVSLLARLEHEGIDEMDILKLVRQKAAEGALTPNGDLAWDEETFRELKEIHAARENGEDVLDDEEDEDDEDDAL